MRKNKLFGTNHRDGSVALKEILNFFSQAKLRISGLFVINLGANYPRIDMLKFLTVGPPAFRLWGRSKVGKN